MLWVHTFDHAPGSGSHSARGHCSAQYPAPPKDYKVPWFPSAELIYSSVFDENLLPWIHFASTLEGRIPGKFQTAYFQQVLSVPWTETLIQNYELALFN